MSFAENMKKLRIKKGFSQVDLEKRSGISQSAISSIERGERSPTEETMIMLAKGLGVSVNSLIDQNEKTPAVKASELDEELVNLLVDLPAQDVQRVRDFVSGLIASRAK